LALLSQHYRSDWEWTDSLLRRAERRLARWLAAVAGGGVDPAATVDVVRRALADDLDAPAALAAIDNWCEAAEAVRGVTHQGSPGEGGPTSPSTGGRAAAQATTAAPSTAVPVPAAPSTAAQVPAAPSTAAQVPGAQATTAQVPGAQATAAQVPGAQATAAGAVIAAVVESSLGVTLTP
jgi:hypothetical protein